MKAILALIPKKLVIRYAWSLIRIPIAKRVKESTDLTDDEILAQVDRVIEEITK